MLNCCSRLRSLSSFFDDSGIMRPMLSFSMDGYVWSHSTGRGKWPRICLI